MCIRPVFRWLLSVAFALAAGPAVLAQDPLSEGAVAADGPSEADLSSWLDQLKQSTSVADEDRAVIKEAYERAVQHIAAAKVAVQRAASLNERRGNVAKDLADVSQQLAAPAAETKAAVPQDATSAQVEPLAAKAQVDKAAADKALKDVEDERRLRTERRSANPADLQQAQTRLAEVDNALSEMSSQASADPLTPLFARRQALRAEKKALRARVDELQAELPSFDARSEVLAKRLELAQRKQREAAEAAASWAQALTELRQAEAEREAARAREAKRQAEMSGLPEMKEVAERNVQLSGRRTGPRGLLSKIEAAGIRLKELEAEKDSVESEYKSVKDKIERVGLSDALGRYLRRHRSPETALANHRQQIGARDRIVDQLTLEDIDLEEEQRRVRDVEQVVLGVMTEVAPKLRERGFSDTDLDSVLEQLRRQFLAQQELLKSVRGDLETYLGKLSEMDTVERGLILSLEGFEDYLGEHILWIRSSPPLGPESLPAARKAFAWLLNPAAAWSACGRLLADLKSRPTLYFACLLFIWVLRPIRHRLRTISERPSEGASGLQSPLAPVIGASLLVALRAMALPLAIWFVAYRLGDMQDAVEYEKALSGGLAALASMVFMAQVLRQVARRGGLAERHFEWPETSLAPIRQLLPGFVLVSFPLVFVQAFFAGQDDLDRRESLGRLVFIGVLLVGCLVSLRLRGSFRGIVASLRGGADRVGAWTFVFMLTGVWTPLVLIVLAAYGYFYTATELADRALATGSVFIGLVFVLTVVDRWTQYHRRLLARERLRRRREEALAASEGKTDEERGELLAGIPLELDEVDLRKANDQTRRLLRSTATILFLVGLFLIWLDVLPALKILNDKVLWERETGDGAEAITLVNLLAALVVVVVTGIVGSNVPGFLELAILPRLPLEAGSRYAVLTLTRYLITITGGVLAFNFIGLHWQDVQWLAAAVTVGLGFGLQEIFSNFVSGLILLFERPVRVGDTVTLGTTTGIVTRIRMRATTITDWDRKELIIPNREFITGQIMNWSLTDTVIRMVFPIGVAYGSDVKLVERLLLRAANDHKMVLADPPPSVVMTGFGDSSLNFDLRLFIPSVDVLILVRHDVNRAIDAMFRRNEISIPFPQRDVHVHTVNKAGAEAAGQSGSAGV